MRMVAQAGYRVENVDATVIAERPRLGPYVSQMRRAIAETLGLAEAKVNVKATTSEGLGDIGRGRGMAALAVTLLGEREA